MQSSASNDLQTLRQALIEHRADALERHAAVEARLDELRVTITANEGQQPSLGPG